MPKMPSLAAAEWEAALKHFGFSFRKRGIIYACTNHKGINFTVHFPHDKAADPTLVRKWVRYMQVDPEEFLTWYRNR